MVYCITALAEHKEVGGITGRQVRTRIQNVACMFPAAHHVHNIISTKPAPHYYTMDDVR